MGFGNLAAAVADIRAGRGTIIGNPGIRPDSSGTGWQAGVDLAGNAAACPEPGNQAISRRRAARDLSARAALLAGNHSQTGVSIPT